MKNKKDSSKQSISSIIVLITMSVAICGVVGYYAWRNTQPLSKPIPADMRPVEFAPTSREVSDGQDVFTVEEARFALHGQTIEESISGFEPISIQAAFGQLNIEAVNFVSADSELSEKLAGKIDSGYDLSKCLFVRYTTTNYAASDNEDAENFAFPSFAVVTVGDSNGITASRSTIDTMYINENGALVSKPEGLIADVTFYAIIPLQAYSNDELVDIRDISNELALRLGCTGSINISYDWLLTDDAVAAINRNNEAYQDEVEANMTLPTSETVQPGSN